MLQFFKKREREASSDNLYQLESYHAKLVEDCMCCTYFRGGNVWPGSNRESKLHSLIPKCS